ncbi:MAG: hypothetical protein Q8P34_08315 [Bacteroidota bacterium]|nr:hypothetical protein [Bacteroidota bacterium]
MKGIITRQDNPELWQIDFIADAPELDQTEEKALKAIIRKIYGKPITISEPEQIKISKKVKPRFLKAILKSKVQKSDFPEIWPEPLPGWMELLTPDEEKLLLKIARQSRILHSV